MAKKPYAPRTDDSPIDPKAPFGAGTIKERYKAGIKAIRAEQWNYWTNYAFMLGEQWLYVDPVRNTIDQLPRDPDRVRIVVNKMWPSSRVIISKLTSRELAFDVPPTAADDATIRASHLAESILSSVKRDHDWEGMREDASWGAWKGGTAALCMDWDPEAGQAIGLDPTGRNLGTGDTRESALSIVDFVVEPGVRDAEHARWWIKCIALPPEHVQEQYGLAKAPKADASAALTPFQSKLLSEHSSVGSDSASVDLTKVFTYYERPNKLCPQGRLCVVVGDEIVDQSVWPFPFKERLNFALIRETRIENRWVGETVVRIARPVQTALNQSWSSIVEHMKLAGNARLLMPQSATDLIDQLTDAPGEALPYPDGITPPAYLSPPQMPAWWIEQPKVLSEQMDDILGVHDVSRGAAPVNIESGLGLSILAEHDTTPIGRMAKETASAFSRLATMVLMTYSEKVTETRQAAVMSGAGQAPETIHWIGTDLLGQVQANVPLDAIMPRSKAQQLQFATQAMQMGLITTLEQFVHLSDMPQGVDTLEALSPDIGKARRENYEMAAGETVVPATFDDHNVHNPEHLAFMKSSRWNTLSQQVQEVFLQHVQAHASLSAEQLANAQSKMAVSPLLASAAQVDSTPVLPPEAALGGMGGGGAPPGPAGPPGKPTPDVPSDVATQSKLVSRSIGPMLNPSA